MPKSPVSGRGLTPDPSPVGPVERGEPCHSAPKILSRKLLVRWPGSLPALGIGAGGTGASSTAGVLATRPAGGGAGGAGVSGALAATGDGRPPPRPLGGGVGACAPVRSSGGRSGAKRVRRRSGPPAGAGQGRDLDPLVRGLHEPAPDLDRQVAARDLLGRAVVVVAEPHRGDEIAGVADEPGVTPVLTGAGLARRLPAGQFGLAGGAGQQRLLHHLVHHRDVLRLDDAAEVGVAAGIEELPVGGAHLHDHVRLNAGPAVGERGVGRGHFERGHRRGAERDRRDGLELGRNAEPVRDLDHRLRPDLEAEPDRDGVQRQRQGLGQRHRAEIFAAVVFRVPALDRDRRVPRAPCPG